MKKYLSALLALVLAVLLLSGCAARPQQINYGGETLTVDTERDTVSDGVHEYEYTYENDNATLVYPNGVVYDAWLSGMTADEWASIADYAEPRALVSVIEEAESAANRDDNVRMILSGVFLLGLSLFELWNPTFFWDLRNHWQFKEQPELSEEFLGIKRLCSIGGIILSILLIIIGFLI